jgi:hypothetical protein
MSYKHVVSLIAALGVILALVLPRGGWRREEA